MIIIKVESTDGIEKNLETMSKHGGIGEKAIVKKTGEEAKITKSWGVKTINVSIDLDGESLSNLISKYKEEITFTKELDLPISVNKEEPKEWLDNWFYELDNGDKVTKDDVITGSEDIRDYKIDQINGIQ
jgi:hypothetical protein